jgi:hypothetical protein
MGDNEGLPPPIRMTTTRRVTRKAIKTRKRRWTKE